MKTLVKSYCLPIVIGLAAAAVLNAAEPIRPGIAFEKTNQVVLDIGPAESFDACQAKYPSILKVGDEWWMWYNGRSKDCFIGDVGLATSDDGWKWEKARNGQPVFRHGPQGAFDSTKTDHPTVLRFDGKYHMWYTGGDDDDSYTIGYATSPDGISWNRENDGQPVLVPGEKGKFDDGMLLHPAVVRDENGLLHIWYNGVGPQDGFRVGHATSEDGVHWTRLNSGNPVLEPGMMDGDRENYVYNVFVLLEQGTFHMWYSASFKQFGSNTYQPRSNAITYASSKDGTRWKKDTTPVLHNGPLGSIDEYAAFACCVVRRNDGLWMYYSCGTQNPRLYRTTLAIHRF